MHHRQFAEFLARAAGSQRGSQHLHHVSVDACCSDLRTKPWNITDHIGTFWLHNLKDAWKGQKNALMIPFDVCLIYVTRCLRMLAFGSIGLILALYLHELGLSDRKIGAVLALSLLGDAVLSLVVTLYADRLGRRLMLLLGCAFKMLAAVMFCVVRGSSFILIAFAACVGVVSPSGNEVGPFMALEQSIMSELISPSLRTTAFAWFNVVGYASSAVGSAEAGILVQTLHDMAKWPLLRSYRAVFVQYGVLVVPAAAVFLLMSSKIEAPAESAAESNLNVSQKAGLGLSAKSAKTMALLSALFALDSFAGSLVTGTLLAYYFQQRFAVGPAYLGGLLFTSNIIAGASSLASGWIASRVGLINTMVFTHLPSNILTILVPLMPSLRLATAMVFLRYSISQMDVAPRQSFVAGIVSKSERTATLGIVNVVKSLSASLGPLVTGILAADHHWPVSFFLCGGLKIVYDLALLYTFRHIKPDVETAPAAVEAHVLHTAASADGDIEAPLLGANAQ